MEDIIKGTLEDVRKIEEQIASLLTALRNDGTIDEAHLIPLSSSSDTDQQVEAMGKGYKTGKRAKAQPATASQIRRKSVEMDSAPIPMDTSSSLITKDKDIFRVIEPSLFLVPVMDIWVLGVTLVNSSSTAQNLPELVLNMIPYGADVVDKPCKLFSYSVQVNLLDVKHDTLEKRGIAHGIPYHDTFIPPKFNIQSRKVQPGCQVLLTATFYPPVTFFGNNNQFNIILSILHDGTQLFSRTVEFCADELALQRRNENVFLIHRASILAALDQHKEYFEMNRLLSDGNKSPHKAVERFLTPLGFEKIFSERMGVDSTVDILACIQSQLSPLWGVSFKIEKCSRNVNTIRCVTTARSMTQMYNFLKFFTKWLEKENKPERSKGLRGISCVLVTSPTEIKNIVTTLQSEVNVIMELIELKQRGSLAFDNSNGDSNWIRKFMEALTKTDGIFMKEMSSDTKRCTSTK